MAAYIPHPRSGTTQAVFSEAVTHCLIPFGLAVAIHKALGQEPGDRHADVTAFRQELNQFA